MSTNHGPRLSHAFAVSLLTALAVLAPAAPSQANKGDAPLICTDPVTAQAVLGPKGQISGSVNLHSPNPLHFVLQCSFFCGANLGVDYNGGAQCGEVKPHKKTGRFLIQSFAAARKLPDPCLYPILHVFTEGGEVDCISAWRPDE